MPDKALAPRRRSLSEEGRSWLQDKSKLYNDLQHILYIKRLCVTVLSISYPSILTASSRDEIASLVEAI